MILKLSKKNRRKIRHRRIRKKVKGTKERPRLSVYKTNLHIYAQLINDEEGRTLTSASSLEIKEKMSGIEKAKRVGEIIGERILNLGIKRIVFDRGGYKYTGRVKKLAEALREKGLEF
ncbi:MAG: 50S ribosomal protein L18 [Minisyncoccia bacterium]